MSVIGEKAMIAACAGHVERMGVMAEDIVSAMAAESISPDEAAGAIQAIADERQRGGMTDQERPTYVAAAIDGFMIGVRAARAASTELEQLKEMYDRLGVVYEERARTQQPSTMPASFMDAITVVAVEAKESEHQIGYIGLVADHYFNDAGELVGTGCWE